MNHTHLHELHCACFMFCVCLCLCQQDLSSHQECLDLLNNSIDALTLMTQHKEWVTAGGGDISTLACANSKRSIDTDQSTTQKRSRTCEQSHSGHHDPADDLSCMSHCDTCDQSLDMLHHCKPAVVVSDKFDETHVRRLTSCSLKECLCHCQTGLSSPQPGMGTDTETTDVSSAPASLQTQQTRTVCSDTPPDSPARRDRGVGDKDDIGSCDIVMGNQDSGKRQLVTTALLLDCVTHPDVIALICQKLTDKLDMT